MIATATLLTMVPLEEDATSDAMRAASSAGTVEAT
jgi:hypothetical protein